MEETKYPNNSRAAKVIKKAPPVEKVVNSKVVSKKKTFGDKFKETFLAEDLDNVKDHLIWDVLIPAAKSTIDDLTKNAVSMMLYGSTSRNKNSRVGRHQSGGWVEPRTDYRNSRPDSRSSSGVNNRALHNFTDEIIEDREEAVMVLDRLVDRIDEYGAATVADFYDYIGKSYDWTAGDYGWDSIEAFENFGATVRAVRGGYIINLPKPRLLKRR
jgi:hypothetical protein